MMRRLLMTGLACAVLTTTSFSRAAEKDSSKELNDRHEAKQAEAIFEKIKCLAGDWEHKGHVTLGVRVIAAGSAVVQREFPGTPMEMITFTTGTAIVSC